MIMRGKGTYFKIVGYIELISTAILLVGGLITVISYSLIAGPYAWLIIFGFVIVAFVAPALGLLFISYGNYLEERKLEQVRNEAIARKKMTNKNKPMSVEVPANSYSNSSEE